MWAASRLVQRCVECVVWKAHHPDIHPIHPNPPTQRRRRRRRAIEALLGGDDDQGQGQRRRCIGLAVDMGSSSVRCSAYVLRPGGQAVAVPGTLCQVTRDALDPATGTAEAGRVLEDVEAVVDGCLRCVL